MIIYIRSDMLRRVSTPQAYYYGRLLRAIENYGRKK